MSADLTLNGLHRSLAIAFDQAASALGGTMTADDLASEAIEVLIVLDLIDFDTDEFADDIEAAFDCE